MQINNLKVGETAGTYIIEGQLTANEIIELAIKLARGKTKKGTVISSPYEVVQYLRAIYGLEERELFSVLYLDTSNRVIELSTLFSGTIDSASIYPREVVKKALMLNATNVILTHNHPSGALQPSQADKAITERIKEALKLIDISILDHVIVSTEGTFSFAEHSLI